MRVFPRKNCFVCGLMAIFSAACFAVAAFYCAKSSRSGLMTLDIIAAMLQAGNAAILFKRAKESV
jgi:hypothetical protein